MRVAACSLMLFCCAGLALAALSSWPTLEQQLAADRVRPGTALERLIQAHQDFAALHPSEAHDTLGLPPWLRVVWREGHPEWRYRPDDPTGGYPHFLKEVREWMRAHQDLIAGPAPPQSSPAEPEATVGTNTRVSGAATNPRSESDIRINFWSPSKVISAANNIGGSGQQVVAYSADGGATWGQTTLPLTSTDVFHSDPTVDWTSNGTAWSGTIGLNAFGTRGALRWYKSTNGGATWTFDSTFSGSQTAVDKPMTWVDHSASSPFKDYAYAIWHNNAPAYMNRKNGAAGTWGTPIKVSGLETLGTAIGADVKTNANGDAFGFWPDTGTSKIFFVKSTDGGTTWSAPRQVAGTYDSYDIGVPSFASRRPLIYVSAGAYRTASKNLVYATWMDLSGEPGCTSPANEPGTNAASPCKTRIWFARSTDGGATWSAPVKVNGPASLDDQFNPWLAVDETSGHLSIAYYDTVADPGRLKTDVWYQNSADDGVTWSPPFKVTTAMTDETAAGADGGNQYGDYNGLTGWNGTFLPSWTDRRNNASEEIWTANITESGCSPPPAPPSGAPALLVDKASSGTGVASLSWTSLAFASGYDAEQGSLDTLLSSGSFGASAQQCVGANVAGTSLDVTGDPNPDSGFWYLVRGRNCGGPGTYDDGSLSQAGSRDAGIASSGHACP